MRDEYLRVTTWAYIVEEMRQQEQPGRRPDQRVRFETTGEPPASTERYWPFEWNESYRFDNKRWTTNDIPSCSLSMEELSVVHRNRISQVVQQRIPYPEGDWYMGECIFPECHICVRHGYPGRRDHLAIHCGGLTWCYENLLRCENSMKACHSCLSVGCHIHKNCPWKTYLFVTSMFCRPWETLLWHAWYIDSNNVDSYPKWRRDREYLKMDATAKAYLRFMVHIDEDIIPLGSWDDDGSVMRCPQWWHDFYDGKIAEDTGERVHILPDWLKKLQNFDIAMFVPGHFSEESLRHEETSTARPWPEIARERFYRSDATIDEALRDVNARAQNLFRKRSNDNRAESSKVRPKSPDSGPIKKQKTDKDDESLKKGYAEAAAAAIHALQSLNDRQNLRRETVVPYIPGKAIADESAPSASDSRPEAASQHLPSSGKGFAHLNVDAANRLRTELRGDLAEEDIPDDLPAWCPFSTLVTITDETPLMHKVRERGIRAITHDKYTDDHSKVKIFDARARGNNLIMRNIPEIGHKAHTSLGKKHPRTSMSLGQHTSPGNSDDVLTASVDAVRGFLACRPLSNNWGLVFPTMADFETRGKRYGYSLPEGVTELPEPRTLPDGFTEAKVLADLFDWRMCTVEPITKAQRESQGFDLKELQTGSSFLTVPYKPNMGLDYPEHWKEAGIEESFHSTPWANAYSIFHNERLLVSDPKTGRGGTILQDKVGLYSEAKPNLGYTMFQNIGGPPGMHCDLTIKIARPKPHHSNQSLDGQGNSKKQQVSS